MASETTQTNPMPRYFALVSRNIEGHLPITNVDDIYTTFGAAKWEWLEYQAKRFRAGLDLDSATQVEEIRSTGSGNWMDHECNHVKLTGGGKEEMAA